MKLNQSLKAEILDVYEAYWGSLLNVDIETYTAVLDKEFKLVGTTEGEVFFKKMEAIRFLRVTADQLAGNIELRNRIIKVEPVDKLILITEQCDAFVNIDNVWTFYAKTRVSSLLQKKDNEWKFVQMHISHPDTKAEEGQTIGLEKISKENIELRDAIKRATVQLENKNRELEIDASLERVRTAAMAMRDSSELGEIINKLYGELTKLDAKLDRCFIMIVNPENKGITWWLAGKEGLLAENGFFIPMNEHPTHLMYLDNWKKRKKKWHYLFDGKEKRDWDRFGFSKTELAKLPDFIKDDMAAVKKIHLSGSSEKFGSLVTGSIEPLTDEHQEIISRFTIAFNQAYIRFLDLQKAEAQVRESQIQLALERVRARTMAMHKSDELADVVALLHEQFEELGFGLYQILISIINTEKQHIEWWSRGFGNNEPPLCYIIPFTNHPFPNTQMQKWESGKTYHAHILEGGIKKGWEKYLFTKTDLRHFPEEVKKQMRSLKQVYLSDAFMKYGVLQAAGPAPLPQDKAEILIRFAKVLDQAYTRMMDLQKAEAQTREAQIQLALERVRARTMAMQKSEELTEVASVLFQQLKGLGISHLRRIAVNIMNETESAWECWYTSIHGDSFAHAIQMPVRGHDSAERITLAWQKKEIFSTEYSGEKLKKFMQFLLNSGWIYAPGDTPPKNFVLTGSPFSQGIVVAFTSEPLPLTDIEIIQRFGRVFEQTYTRFLDLQKAEAQTREAQIEFALERIRAKALAMHSSHDLFEVANTLREQMGSLGQAELESSIVHLYMQDSEKFEAWYAYKTLNDAQSPVITGHASVPKNACSWTKEVMAKYSSSENEYTIESRGQMIKDWYKVIEQLAPLTLEYNTNGDVIVPEVLYYHFSKFSDGALLMISEERPTEEAKMLQQRAAKVFDFAYRRYLDLKLAEAQAREAKIETALEKVRSSTMAMQKSDELAETAAVVFKQLIGLGIAPNRLYIGIIKDDTGDIEAWATDEDGGKVSSMFALSSKRNRSVRKMYDGWVAKKKSLTIDMQGEELHEYINYLSKELRAPFIVGHIQKRRVQNIAYFSKGLIGIASSEDQPEETIQLLERFAAVLNLTFTRFNDLKIAEAHAEQAEIDLIKLKEEKKRTEEALTELKAAQAQLIQSEKMASLGELTAGIAHEIQNPLNFVNNFSEVSSDLIKEMVEEVGKGNTEEVKAIANDVVQNLEKINHHGKRAADIVKGMLQHSRTSSGQKEPTDINVLADEYLRLAYHGLRAKDKSFNATMKTDFDETIGKINIIPQDIGRVILNLITNAFYAVNEKSKQGLTNYEPTVTVSTKKVGNAVFISVKDNGNGIPQKILDKIFQPFFTTKPTGQGTGLGLSLSYDIVKAHGGELKVEIRGAGGSKFIIQLDAK